MNVGYLSRPIPSSRSFDSHNKEVRQMSAYYLRLNPPPTLTSGLSLENMEREDNAHCYFLTTESVGMPVRLFPLSNLRLNYCHQQTCVNDYMEDEWDSSQCSDEEHTESSCITIYLHPVMLHVLVTSSIMSSPTSSFRRSSSYSSFDTITSLCMHNTHSDYCKKMNNTQQRRMIPVQVRSTDNSTIGSTHNMIILGTLEILDDIHGCSANSNEDISRIVNEHPVGDYLIHLEYMCGTIPSKGRNLSQSSRKHQGGIDVKNQTIIIQRIRKYILSHMALIVEGGIIGLQLKDVEHNTLNEDSIDDEIDEHNFYFNGNDRSMVFFMVKKIVITNIDDTAEKRVRYLPILKSTSTSFDIALDIFLDSRMLQALPQYRDVDSMKSETIHFICPGYETVLNELLSLTKMMNYSDAYPTAVVLTGCPGVGKTRMASWLEREIACTNSSMNAHIISAKDVLLGRSLRQFHQYRRRGVDSGMGGLDFLLIIDDLDAVVHPTDETNSSSVTTSEQIRSLEAIINIMDNMINDTSLRCFVLGICRLSYTQLPPSLARVGRFEKEIVMHPPTLVQRRDIFNFWLSTFFIQGNENMARKWADLLAPRTAGCVASDIRNICSDALVRATARIQSLPPSRHHQSITDIVVSWEDIKEAARTCVPSQLSSMDVIPATVFDNESIRMNDHINCSKAEFEWAWSNFGGYEEEKTRLYRTVVRPWKHHIMETNKSAPNKIDGGSIDGILETSRPSGVLFHGPSGCGKSFAVTCLASSLGLHCVKVRASEVFNQWLGGSEAILRSIFSRARAAAPCILFFDELDSLAVNRESGDSDATSGVQSRILTTLLNEMDGITNIGGLQGILVVAATNRLDAIDAALLRPGRLEEHVLLDYPKSACIYQMLMMKAGKMPIDDSVDLVQLSEQLKISNASCAEIEGLCRDACMIAIRRSSEIMETMTNLVVTSSDFDEAIHRIKRGAAYSVQ